MNNASRTRDSHARACLRSASTHVARMAACAACLVALSGCWVSYVRETDAANTADGADTRSAVDTAADSDDATSVDSAADTVMTPDSSTGDTGGGMDVASTDVPTPLDAPLGDRRDWPAVPDVMEPAAPDGGWGTVQTIESVSSTCRSFRLATNPDSDGKWFAIRVVPPRVPFLVEEIAYRLEDGMVRAVDSSWTVTCNPGLAHRVALFQGDATVPAASPEVIAVANVPASAATTFRIARVRLSPPVLVTRMNAFVAVQMTRTPTDGTCLVMCETPPVRFGVSFEGFGTSPLIKWHDAVAEFMHPGVPYVGITGRPAP